MCRVDTGGILGVDGAHGALAHTQAAVDAGIAGFGMEGAGAAFPVGKVAGDGGRGCPPLIELLAHLLRKENVLFQVGLVGPAYGDLPIGVLCHQGSRRKRPKAERRDKLRQLEQRVVKIPVAVGHGDNARGILTAQHGESGGCRRRKAARVDRGAEKPPNPLGQRALLRPGAEG